MISTEEQSGNIRETQLELLSKLYSVSTVHCHSNPFHEPVSGVNVKKIKVTVSVTSPTCIYTLECLGWLDLGLLNCNSSTFQLDTSPKLILYSMICDCCTMCPKRIGET